MESVQRSSVFVLLMILAAVAVVASQRGLSRLTQYNCGCPGQNASYTCTTSGGLITVWSGSAFMCGGNEIALRHNEFEGAIGECNDGAIVGYSVNNTDGFFTSQLDVTLSTSLQGLAITCSIDDGIRVSMIGTEPLVVSTQASPPPRPGNVNVAVNNQELNFTWPPVDYSCPSLSYSFSTSQSCGGCIRAPNSTTVSCSGFIVSNTPQTPVMCEFSVHSVICGNITGEERTSNVNLQVPGAPVLQTIPQYLSGRIKSLTKLMTTFSIGDSISISDNIDGSAMNFTITYSDLTFSSVCGSDIIPASSCVTRTCSHTFDIFESSSCPPSTSIVVTAYANNVLGSGPSSVFVTRDGINNLVDVRFSPSDRSIVCSFLNQPTSTLKSCSANITYGENCDQPLGVYNTASTGNTVRTPPLETRADVTDYCFVVTATSSNVTVMVEGNLVSIGSSGLNAAAIGTPIALIIFVLLIIIASLFLVLGYKLKQDRKKSEYNVKFSVKDEAGSLAKALKVFKDLNINIIGVNTHLHHAEFDRVAEKGYNYNYIYCVVSGAEITFLREQLKAEILGQTDENGDKHNITAVVKVKNKPGGFWEVLDKIGKRGISLTGVNTGEKRESSAGFRETHIKCSCPSTAVQKLNDSLTDIGVMDVEIALHTQRNLEEKAIQYLVRNIPGALASTLEVFTTVGLNITGVNVDHLKGTKRNTSNNLRLNFVECSVDDQMLETLKATLKKDYGAIDVECVNETMGRYTTDPHYRILQITILNETGSLNRALKAFSVHDVNLHGVNVLKPVYTREESIVYKHYHLEIIATKAQFAQLRDALHYKGLATDVNEFDVSKYCDISKLPQHYQILFTNAARQQVNESDCISRTMMIEFFVRNKVGALADALQIFGELGINICKINPAHMASHHQSEYVECFCDKEKRDTLVEKIMSHGATKAEFLPDSEVPQGVNTGLPNYCVVKFSVGSNPTKIVEVLKAFPEIGVEVAKVNPTHIKLLNQYVECCCTDDVREELLSRLKNIKGVIHVKHQSLSEEQASKPQPDNYCVIKFSVHEEAGILVDALKVFFVLKINIIGVNTLTPAFEREETRMYKHNHVVFVGTEEQEKELRSKLLVGGLAIDVKPYERQSGHDVEELPDDLGENGIRLTGVRTSN